MTKALKILETQAVLILELRINMEYQLKLHEIQLLGNRDKVLLKRYYVNYIAKITSNEIISNLYKLIYEKNNYSFDDLIEKAKREKTILIEDDFKYFEQELIFIKEQFHRLDIKKIRDKYVAHLDENRVAVNYYYSDINDLITHIENSFKVLYRSLKNEDIELSYNNDTLSEILDDLVLLKEYLEKE